MAKGAGSRLGTVLGRPAVPPGRSMTYAVDNKKMSGRGVKALSPIACKKHKKMGKET
jgi:hypothetical protein